MDNTPPEIHIHSEVTDTGSKKESRVKITIRDNGIGFDEKYADKIFIIFQRLHGKNEYEGTGIGLAICKRIVERSEVHTYELQSLMRISYAVSCLKKNKKKDY